MRIFLARLLLIISIFSFLCALYIIWERNNPNRIAFNINLTQLPSYKSEKQSLPVLFSIPQLEISLPILSSKIVNGKWEITNAGVSYLSQTPIPGNIGNSVLYGHNWTNLLGNLIKAKPGYLIEIRFADGSSKTFLIDYTVVVTPNQTSILAPSNKPKLTIYTCTGFMDSKRFVAVASPV